MDIGARLKAAREDLSLSHEQLVVKAKGKISRQSIINIEKHGQVPGADTVRALAVALGVSSDYLLDMPPLPTREEEATEAIAEALTDAATTPQQPPQGERRRGSRRADDPPPHA